MTARPDPPALRSSLTPVAAAMYIHCVTRTQLYLDEAIHDRLRELARKQGRTISELVRDALVRAYGLPGADRRIDTLKAIEGLWRDREDIGAARGYVRQLRDGTRRARRLARGRAS